MMTSGSGRFCTHGTARSALPHSGMKFVTVSIVLILIPTAALAAQESSTESTIAAFIAELGILLLVGRIMGEVAQRIGQPAVIGQLIGGVLLGPSVLGLLWPQAQHILIPTGAAQKSMIEGVSQLGILLLLLLTGMETDLPLVKRVGRSAAAVAVAGVVIPLACGVALGAMLPDSLLPNPNARIVTALFLGIALSISSVKIVAMVVGEMNFMRRDIGQIIVASAVLEDTIGWILVAVAFGLASAGRIDVWSVGRAVLGTVLFLAISLTIGRRAVFRLIRFANDNFKSDFSVITTILVIMVAMALITQWIGVNLVLGAFVAGILVGESPILTQHIDEQLRGLIVALFMPVFFGLTGLSADLTILANPRLAELAIGLIVIASAGKFIGAFVGAKLGGLVRSEAVALASAMNARGSTEVIIASIGLSMNVLSRDLFTLIVTMAVLTTMSMPPMLRWALKRVPMRADERARLEREEIDARGFVTNIERLLVAVDDSANGKLAARIAGVIGGADGKPTTVLELTEDNQTKKPRKSEKGSAAGLTDTQKRPEEAADHVKSAAEGVTSLDAPPDEEKRGSVDVTTVRKRTMGPDEIEAEARKGYGLFIIGVADTHGPKGGFGRAVSRIAATFDGPIAIVDTKDSNAEQLLRRPGKIVVPINGTEASRRAAEIAFALARASSAEVAVLYVANPRGGKSGGGRKKRPARHNSKAILNDISTLAERYEVDVRPIMVEGAAPVEAILQEAKRGYDLIVLGANRRPGDTLFFGNTAAAILDRSPIPKLFVAS
jgi:Kef-type K+ transport system membrane component KefB/nucleotide-binding universal stress UspA family protein